MGSKQLTMELLVKAAEDLNKVLGLNPNIGTEFSSSLKGAALKTAEGKFMEQIGKDLVESAQLIQPTDVLATGTVDALELLGVQGIRDKTKTSGEEGKAPAETKKGKEETVKTKEKKTTAKAKKPPKAPAKKAEVNDWGHRKGSQSEKIDDVVKKHLAKDKGKKLDVGVLAKETKLSNARVIMHLKHLKEKKLISVNSF